MRIAVDKAQKEGKHEKKHNQLLRLGHTLTFLPLPVGDYILIDEAVSEVIMRRGSKLKKMDLVGVTNRSVDTKYGIQEAYSCLIGPSHNRFRDECILAQQNGIALTILVESAPEIRCLEDVKKWMNWRQLFSYCNRNGIPFILDYENGNVSETVEIKTMREFFGYTMNHHVRKNQEMIDRIAEYREHGGQKPPVDGEQLYKAMKTSAERHGYKWAFCKPEDAGKAIAYLLTKE